MDNVELNGVILGIESVGGKFIKIDDRKLFITVIKNSEIDTKENLNKISKIVKRLFNLTLMVKFIKPF